MVNRYPMSQPVLGKVIQVHTPLRRNLGTGEHKDSLGASSPHMGSDNGHPRPPLWARGGGLIPHFHVSPSWKLDYPSLTRKLDHRWRICAVAVVLLIALSALNGIRRGGQQLRDDVFVYRFGRKTRSVDHSGSISGGSEGGGLQLESPSPNHRASQGLISDTLQNWAARIKDLQSEFQSAKPKKGPPKSRISDQTREDINSYYWSKTLFPKIRCPDVKNLQSCGMQVLKERTSDSLRILKIVDDQEPEWVLEQMLTDNRRSVSWSHDPMVMFLTSNIHTARPIPRFARLLARFASPIFATHQHTDLQDLRENMLRRIDREGIFLPGEAPSPSKDVPSKTKTPEHKDQNFEKAMGSFLNQQRAAADGHPPKDLFPPHSLPNEFYQEVHAPDQNKAQDLLGHNGGGNDPFILQEEVPYDRLHPQAAIVETAEDFLVRRPSRQLLAFDLAMDRNEIVSLDNAEGLTVTAYGQFIKENHPVSPNPPLSEVMKELHRRQGPDAHFNLTHVSSAGNSADILKNIFLSDDTYTKCSLQTDLLLVEATVQRTDPSEIERINDHLQRVCQLHLYEKTFSKNFQAHAQETQVTLAWVKIDIPQVSERIQQLLKHTSAFLDAEKQLAA
ncbi:unnamed protein product [Cyprideis torosa]|uniref:Uncharacterized protein n=1 Tax=Cyprideis torosa TaxID=163714 RepID=A0A7R8WJE5_9CRUS|nr:unnamed protein product [Cyprideis torosa]CAG0901911.1 unnamed protein product [Cyprideis torosa]